MKTLISIVGVLGFLSCDCYRSFSGTVVDVSTKEPIANAVFYSDKNLKFKQCESNELGFYEGVIISGMGCFKPHFYTVNAPGYKDTLVEIGTDIQLNR